MNDKPETAATADAGGTPRASEQAEDGPSPSSRPAPLATHEGPSFLERLIGLFRPRNGASIREEIVDALAETVSDPESFSAGERTMLNNILRLREVRVEDVMIPRTDIEAVDINITLGALMNQFERSGHSRMPVYSGSLDDPRGMVHIRDVLAHITATARSEATGETEANGELDLGRVKLTRTLGELQLIRTVLFAPPSMLASDLMARMQAARTQMALVIDEYGGTDGLVSLEDIVEMVVGDIEDEHDEEEPLFTRAGDGVYLVDGKADIEEVAAMIGDGFQPGEHGEYVDTIGGMIFAMLGHVPERGEVIQVIPGFDFHILDADPRRVKRVRIVDLDKADRRRRPARAGQA